MQRVLGWTRIQCLVVSLELPSVAGSYSILTMSVGASFTILPDRVETYRDRPYPVMNKKPGGDTSINPNSYAANYVLSVEVITSSNNKLNEKRIHNPGEVPLELDHQHVRVLDRWSPPTGSRTPSRADSEAARRRSS
ncbi:hypothetical protein FE257_004355 [Aspergillus nanangensis]|uniref:Uncharacterized protein n=1 Tax=Aspergillus nanangensis TaxID=2582783 RepID=A0AAD4GN37_ASPNN|nr:hypothetical protein FE257_004355 [Aspergillus nanangensis]